MLCNYFLNSNIDYLSDSINLVTYVYALDTKKISAAFFCKKSKDWFDNCTYFIQGN